jgi:hypothetical protein
MSIGNLKPFAEALGLEDGTLLIILRAAGCIVRSDDKDEWVQGVLKKIIPIPHEIRKHNNIRYLRLKLTDGCELNTQSTPVAFENSCPEDNYQPKYKAEFEAVREQYGLKTSKSLNELVSINDGSILTKSVVPSPTSSPSSTAVHDMKLLYDVLSSEQRKQLCELYLQDTKPDKQEERKLKRVAYERIKEEKWSIVDTLGTER